MLHGGCALPLNREQGGLPHCFRFDILSALKGPGVKLNAPSVGADRGALPVE